MEIIKPPRLKVGDTIGLIAPSKSAHFIRDVDWQRGIARLHNKGFNVVEGQATRGTVGHTGTTSRERLDDIERMFRDDQVHALMAICGGSNSNQVLDQLDYEMISRHPKIVIGFSDTTALTTALNQKLGWVTFSGPSFLTFCQPDLPDYTELYFDQLLTEGVRTVALKPAEAWSDDIWWKEAAGTARKWHENTGWEIYRHGKASGKILGGNLETLLTLAGTPYWPDCTGAILFIECCGEERPATINRFLTQLRLMGVFNQITGLVIGRFTHTTPFGNEDTCKSIVEDATAGTKFPIIANVDFGHTDPMVTLPIGVTCQMDTVRNQIAFTESAVL